MISKLLNIALIVLILALVGNYIYKLPKYSIGNEVPSLSFVTTNGSTINLDSVSNKYVLLHFWGSWCPSCRRKNPELVRLYKTYLEESIGESDFTIISIALEKNKEKYQNAVDLDGIFWESQIVVDNLFQSEIAKLYGIREIPTTYLIGPDRKVLMTNPKISNLKKFLKNLNSDINQGQID